MIKRVLFARHNHVVIPKEMVSMLVESLRRTDEMIGAVEMPYAVGYEVQQTPSKWELKRVELDKSTGEILQYCRKPAGYIDFAGNVHANNGVFSGNVHKGDGFAALDSRGFIREKV